MNQSILKRGYLHKAKNPKANTLFGKTNKRWFVINVEERTFSYSATDKAKKVKKTFKIDVSHAHYSLLRQAMSRIFRKLKSK